MDIICALGGTKKLFVVFVGCPKKMRLHPQKVQYGNFRFVMEEMTSFVFCQVPWENRVVNMKALFAFTPLQVNNFSATRLGLLLS